MQVGISDGASVDDLSRRVWTRGLEWDLDGQSTSSLTFGQFISTSNRICSEVVVT